MSEGVMLSELLDMLRAEARLSTNVAHNQAARDAQVHLLRRVQEELAAAHDWPNLKVSRDVALVAGSGTYEYPEDLDFGWINGAYVEVASQWLPLAQGIEPEHESIYPATFQTWPVLRWAHEADETRQFRVWPLPSEAGTLRFRGRKRIGRLVDATDKTTLDANVIAMFAAAEILAGNKAEDAQLKLQKAQNHLNRIKARYSRSKSSVLVMGGGGRASAGRIGLDYIPSGYGKGG